MIGRVISGRYVVEAVVGTGGMAVVYRAYDKIRKQTVAVKVLRPEYESDGEFVRRFSREAEAASKVSHENIVNMLDVGKDGDRRYIVMEFVDGQTLKEMIRQQGRISPDVALRMTIRILGQHSRRIDSVSSILFPAGLLGETLVLACDLAGLAISAGSACHSDSPEPSPSLLAMGLSPSEAVRVVRLSFGFGTIPAEMAAAYRILGDTALRLWQQ